MNHKKIKSLDKVISLCEIYFLIEKGACIVKPEWGKKRFCSTCLSHFYDMCRHPMVCPKCHSQYDAQDFLGSLQKNHNLKQDTVKDESFEHFSLGIDDSILEEDETFDEDEKIIIMEKDLDQINIQ
jgi:uncharacterized protein (TIGR02300 family)